MQSSFMHPSLPHSICFIGHALLLYDNIINWNDIGNIGKYWKIFVSGTVLKKLHQPPSAGLVFILSAVSVVVTPLASALPALQLLYQLSNSVTHSDLFETECLKWDTHPSSIWYFWQKERGKHANGHGHGRLTDVCQPLSWNQLYKCIIFEILLSFVQTTSTFFLAMNWFHSFNSMSHLMILLLFNVNCTVF